MAYTCSQDCLPVASLSEIFLSVNHPRLFNELILKIRDLNGSIWNYMNNSLRRIVSIYKGSKK